MRANITRANAARNFPNTIFQSLSGFVSNNSMVPIFFSSAKLFMVMAGTKKINT